MARCNNCGRHIKLRYYYETGLCYRCYSRQINEDNNQISSDKVTKSRFNQQTKKNKRLQNPFQTIHSLFDNIWNIISLVIIILILGLILAPHTFLSIIGIHIDSYWNFDSIIKDLPHIVNLAKSGKPNENISSIYLPSNLLNEINKKFNSESVEFRLCLFGKGYKDGVLITSLKEPYYYSRSSMGVSAEDCTSYSLGYLHSHPNGYCYLSGEDESNIINQDYLIQGIICQVDRMKIYSKKNVYKELQVHEVNINDNNTIHIKRSII